VDLVVGVQGKAELPELRRALGREDRGANLLDTGQEHGYEHRDDAHCDESLDERDTGSLVQNEKCADSAGWRGTVRWRIGFARER
jgi:hypothetical protein